MKNKHLYPENWEDTIRPAILQRDKYKCCICGVAHRAIGYYDVNKQFIICDEFMQDWANRQGLKIQKIHLQIMHINHIKDDVRPENLQAGCPRCHLNHDRDFNTILRRARGRQQPKQF
jgi:5-methylcytosine-specific restriction endonuclease McrA